MKKEPAGSFGVETAADAASGEQLEVPPNQAVYLGSLGVLWFLWFAAHPMDVLPFLVLLLFYASRHRRHALTWFLLSPLVGSWVLGLGLGTWDYLDGRAKLVGYASGPLRAGNLDPTYRLPVEQFGCLRMGYDYGLSFPRNFAVTSLVSVFGPQKGSYTGPLPSNEEVLATLDREGGVPVGYSRDPLGTKVRRLDGSEFLVPWMMQEKAHRIAVYKDRLALFEVVDAKVKWGSRTVYFFDLEREGHLFRWYETLSGDEHAAVLAELRRREEAQPARR